MFYRNIPIYNWASPVTIIIFHSPISLLIFFFSKVLKNFISGNGGAPKISSSISFRVKNPKTKTFLKLFKSYFSLILILGCF